jgi:GNAT superfamily N-acetyltransferase
MSTDEAPGARPAGPGDLDRVVEIIVGAFYADPVWAWAFPDPDLRRAQHRRFWRLYVEGAARYSSVWLNAEETSAAVWIPPGGAELTPEQEASVEPLLIELLGRAGAARVMDAGDAFERAHPREPGHHYLSLLGTDPAHRGKGLGLALLQQTVTRADSDGLPAYLEASNPVNVPLYERYGFRPKTTFALPGGGPEVTTMWREPRG